MIFFFKWKKNSKEQGIKNIKETLFKFVYNELSSFHIKCAFIYISEHLDAQTVKHAVLSLRIQNVIE